MVTPDRIVVPEWGLEDMLWKREWLAWTMDGNTLVVSSSDVHNLIYNKFRIDRPCFDGRLDVGGKRFTFWWDKSLGGDTWKERVRTVVERFGHGNFYSEDTVMEPIDVTSWEFFFTGKVDGELVAVRCSYSELLEWDGDVVDTLNGRFLTGFRRLWKGETTPYMESCRYWKKKIGNMDVAQWHLLIYSD